MGERAELLSAILDVSNYVKHAEVDVRRVQNAAYLVYLATEMNPDTMSLIEFIRVQFDRLRDRPTNQNLGVYIEVITKLINGIMAGWVM